MEDSLLAPSDQLPPLWRNYIWFCVLFSSSHGATTATLALSASFIGEESAGVANGTLYIAYGLTALLVAMPIMRCFRVREVLAAALFLACAYSISCDEITSKRVLAAHLAC